MYFYTDYFQDLPDVIEVIDSDDEENVPLPSTQAPPVNNNPASENNKPASENNKPAPLNDNPAPAANNDECVICTTNALTHALVPCGHRMCEGCAYQFLVDHNCPFCRQFVDQTIHIY